MEAHPLGDIADGPLTAMVENVTVTLDINPWGEVELSISKAGKALADVPARLKKQQDIARLRERKVGLKKLASVRLKDRFVLIDGKLGSYTLHLGSAITRKMPGETLFIVPVHSQHRGRLFLPFADDDPKTAEVLSKVLLLARDGEIKDPASWNRFGGDKSATHYVCLGKSEKGRRTADLELK